MLEHTLVPYGITTTFVDPSSLDNFRAAIYQSTTHLSIGTEHVDDLIADLDQALEKM